MSETVVKIIDGPDKPALQWAVVYSDRGQTVIFRLPGDAVEASILRMDEAGAGFDFDLTGKFVTGPLKGKGFEAHYSVETRSGSLVVSG